MARGGRRCWMENNKRTSNTRNDLTNLLTLSFTLTMTQTHYTSSQRTTSPHANPTRRRHRQHLYLQHQHRRQHRQAPATTPTTATNMKKCVVTRMARNCFCRMIHDMRKTKADLLANSATTST